MSCINSEGAFAAFERETKAMKMVNNMNLWAAREYIGLLLCGKGRFICMDRKVLNAFFLYVLIAVRRFRLLTQQIRVSFTQVIFADF
jgi:hypothetical protein